jgi:DNA mismatch endonuclease, patch repair protein
MVGILKLPKKRKGSLKNYKCSNIEGVVRRGLYAKGYRYRANVYPLPGRPDLVLHKYNAIIFVNGCYWHAHNCNLFKVPATNRGSWLRRFGETVDRDEKNIKNLLERGWRVALVWECSLRGDQNKVLNLLSEWIESEDLFCEISEDNLESFEKKYYLHNKLLKKNIKEEFFYE